MKSRIGLAVACLFGLAVAAQAANSVKLANPSFEEPEQDADNPYGDLAAGWGRWGGWINRETAWKPTKQGKCMIGYHHWQIEEDSTSGIYQDLAGTPADAEFTFSVYASKDKDTNAEFVELRLEPYNGGDAIASKLYSMDEIKKGWSKLEVTGKSIGEGIRVLVIVKPASGSERAGCLKFDDADLDIVPAGEKPLSTLAGTR